MTETFFGLNEEYKKNIIKDIFDIVYFSEGRFTYSEIYEMPVYLKNSIRSLLIVELKKEEKRQKDINSKIKTK